METIDEQKNNLRKSFCAHRDNLTVILHSEELKGIVNHDDKLKIICALSSTFLDYYNGVATLLKYGNFSSIYSVGRSSLECFAYLKSLCDEFFNNEKFYEIYKYMLFEDVCQIFKIWKKETDDNNQMVLLQGINSKLLVINFTETINPNGTIEEIKTDTNHKINQIKSNFHNMEKCITDRIENTLKELPEYNTAANGVDCATLYPELCRLSHNNISGIVERHTVLDDGQPIFCDEHPTDNLIYPVLYMFVACGRYIEWWLKDNVLTDKKNTENE